MNIFLALLFLFLLLFYSVAVVWIKWNIWKKIIFSFCYFIFLFLVLLLLAMFSTALG